ncbi:G patch domain and KOW motifs-containing protein, partial [Stegodyphus mimosarum]
MDKEFQAVKIDSVTGDRQNVSFKFTKTSSKTLSGNRLEDDVKEKDYVLSIAESEIKSALPKEKVKELVIPMIRKNNWRTSNTNAQDTGDEDSKIKDLAIQELLKETSEQNEKWEKREFKNYTVTIPLIMQNKIPDGFETDEKLDVSLRPEEPKLEDYEKVPVEQYGLAMLRGMGWKEGDPIGANSSKIVEPVQVQLRPKGLGLGADASALKKNQKKESDEKLDLVKGSYVLITQGSHKGSYGEVLGLDEENARAIVKFINDGKIQTFPEFFVNVVSKKEYDKESRVINRISYENYKDKECKVKQEQHTESKDSDRKHSSQKHDKRKSESDLPKEKNADKRHKSSKKRHHSRERGVENYISGSEHKSTKSWVRPQLRVRLIDDKYKKGKYFNMKLVVVDVLSPRRCICKTDDGKCLDDISPSMLETVIPRNESDYVMIVRG